MRTVFGMCLLVLVAGCGSDIGDARHGNAGPPPIRILGNHPVDLSPISGCWYEQGIGRCADMGQTPVGRLPHRTGDRVDLDVPGLDALSIKAGMTPLPPPPFGCQGDGYDAEVAEHDGIYSLTPRAPAGRYRVTVSGTAEEGDLGGEFVWRTSTDTAPAHPRAQIRVVHQPHGVLEGDIFHLSIVDLPREIGAAHATIRVESVEGNSYQFDAGRAHRWCPTGLDFAERGIADSHQAAMLGQPPFTYDVMLDVDGQTYRARAVWPNDHLAAVQEDDAGWVPLTFEPPLPQAE